MNSWAQLSAALRMIMVFASPRSQSSHRIISAISSPKSCVSPFSFIFKALLIKKQDCCKLMLSPCNCCKFFCRSVKRLNCDLNVRCQNMICINNSLAMWKMFQQYPQWDCAITYLHYDHIILVWFCFVKDVFIMPVVITFKPIPVIQLYSAHRYSFYLLLYTVAQLKQNVPSPT